MSHLPGWATEPPFSPLELDPKYLVYLDAHQLKIPSEKECAPGSSREVLNPEDWAGGLGKVELVG